MSIYLDHHAATPLLPTAREAVGETLAQFANPASTHARGRSARRRLEQAREAVAASVGARPADIILTSGGTEACNLMVSGLAARAPLLITTEVEHPAVARALESRARGRTPLRRLPVPEGHPPSPDELAEHLVPDALVVLQWVNHETGSLFPVDGYAEQCRAAGAFLAVDASQAFGRVPIDVEDVDVDALALASQKVGGPSGAGALWVRRDIELSPRELGGGQERGRRAGTPATAALSGFGAAAAAIEERLRAMPTIARWRNLLQEELRALGAAINAEGAPRVASVVSASVPGWRGDILVAALDVEGLCASSGPACSSGLGEPSAVLQAMYPDRPARAASALRLSLGPEDLDERDIGVACEVLRRVLRR